MRRISLALALMGAVAVTGCMGGSPSQSGTATGGQKGSFGSSFSITIPTPPIGGKIVSDVGTINCGASAQSVSNGSYDYTYLAGASALGCGEHVYGWSDTVTLTATAMADKKFIGWGGDCPNVVDATTGLPKLTCVLTAGADKTVIALFGNPGTGGHPNFTSPALHGPAYIAFLSSTSGALQCTSCHGASLQGQSIAPACNTCHEAPPLPSLGAALTAALGKVNWDPAPAEFMHMDTAGLAWQMHGTPGTGWSAACQRCHTSGGFKDYVGADGAANHMSGSFQIGGNVSNTDAGTGTYTYGPLKCSTCHNTASDPYSAGLTQVTFPSLQVVSTDKSTALCGQCHGARESTASLNAKITSNILAANRGLGLVSISAATSGSAGTTTTLVKSGFTASAYKGYTAIFTGNLTTALNGAKAVVSDNTTTTITFASTLPAAPAFGFLEQGTIPANLTSYAAATGGSTTTLVNSAAPFGNTANGQVGKKVCLVSGNLSGSCIAITASSSSTLTFALQASAVANGDRYIVASATSDSAVFYPTATGGSTTTLADTNRAWTVNQWAGFYVFLQTGVNQGLYRLIASNTTDTLTLTGAFTAAVASGDFYAIVPKEETAVLDDTVNVITSFTNAHYFGAAATIFGADAAGWFQYPVTAGAASGRYAVYTGTNQHGVSAGSCVSCHDPHSLTVTVNENTCGRCHFKADGSPVTSLTELEENRQFGFEGDIDGAGTESLKTALANNAAKLYAAIQAYATNVVGTSICYDGATYPYFLLGTSTACGGASANSAFNKFTPRLLRAAYNYNLFVKEPGAWAHNPRYVAEILYDAIVDLNAGLTAKGQSTVAFAGARAFAGHFGAATSTAKGGGEQFRDWDAAVVPNNCSQCHAGKVGFANALANTLTTATNRPVSGMQCTTCHAPAASDTDMTRIRSDVANVLFPPAKAAGLFVSVPAASFANAASATCATCHSGRENATTITNKTVSGGSDIATWTLTFTNPHYFGAAGILFGSDTAMMYQYATKTYAATKTFGGSAHGASCIACHEPKASKHTFEVDLAGCASCHKVGGEVVLSTRQANLVTLASELYTAITAYSQAAGKAVCYNGAAYPYWYLDTNANGTCDAGETGSAKFDAKALRAAFNYKWSQAELGAYAHNYEYMGQVLYDAIVDLGGTPSVSRP